MIRGTLASAFDRPPFNSPWVRDTTRHWALPLWFGLISVPGLLLPSLASPNLFSDARLYLEACAAWLDGGNPWSVQINGQYFAAPPPTLLPLAPFALLPEPLGTIALGALCSLAGVATIRILGLQLWWLLFPPMVQGMLAGNVQMLLIPLILGGGGWAGPVLKIYAAVPLAILGRFRALAVAAAVVLLTVPLLPWSAYIEDFGQINATLAAQSSYGPPFIATLLLLPAGVVSLRIVGRDRAAWLAVPALWPSQQWYYATLILPARSRVAAAIVAAPIPLAGFLALVATAVIAVLARREPPPERADTDLAGTAVSP